MYDVDTYKKLFAQVTPLSEIESKKDPLLQTFNLTPLVFPRDSAPYLETGRHPIKLVKPGRSIKKVKFGLQVLTDIQICFSCLNFVAKTIQKVPIHIKNNFLLQQTL